VGDDKETARPDRSAAGSAGPEEAYATKLASAPGFELRAQLIESEQERLGRAINALEVLRASVDAERRQKVDLTIARLKEAFEADAAVTGHR
jgi:hypothetical protein